MREFLILKLEGDDPRSATVCGVVLSEDGPDAAITQGFRGEGRYAIVDWAERVEADLGQGPVQATDLQDKAAREAGAEVAEEAAK